MDQDRHIWRVWASILQQWGVEDWAAAVLEACGPWAVIGAQVVHMSQPWLQNALPGDHMNALARLLEEPLQAQQFVSYLREKTTQ
jgi:hypothetical protein